jgi:hypothetical protein
MSTKGQGDQPTLRETLHALSNALGAARMWLVVLDNASPAEREKTLPDLLATLHRTVGDAEEACHLLRALLLDAPPRERGG